MLEGVVVQLWYVGGCGMLVGVVIQLWYVGGCGYPAVVCWWVWLSRCGCVCRILILNSFGTLEVKVHSVL